MYKKSTRHPRFSKSHLTLAFAVVLSANAPTALAGWLDALPNILPSAIQKPDSSTATGNASQSPSPAANVNLFKTSPANMRNKSSMGDLFAKGTVNGKELITEMRAIRQIANSTRTERAFSSLMGAIDSSAATMDTSRFDLGRLGESLGGALLKETRSSVSYAALDSFFDIMTGDPEALAKETIQLPSSEGLDLAQQQRILNMAALVVGARVANKIADDADNTYGNLEKEYERLLKRREEIAAILADVVDKRRKAAAARDELAMREMTTELARYLGKEDIEFIDSFGQDRPLKEFATDFGMQNVALEFLRRQSPKAYADYRATSDDLVGRTKAYVKTIGGVVAFGGLLSGFTNEIALTSKDKNARNILAMLPLGLDFVSAAAPLMAKNVKTSFTGITVASSSLLDMFGGGERLFRVVGADGKIKDVRSSSSVFEALHDKGEDGRLQDALFQNGTSGLLYKIYVCDADATGRMLDKAVPDDLRDSFGKEFMRLPEGERFYFLNALTQENTPNRKKLVSDLLGSDQRKRSGTPLIGKVQLQVVGQYSKWSDSQLARMILANHYGPISHAQMQVGNTLVRLIPTMTAVYEYETYADSCRATARKS